MPGSLLGNAVRRVEDPDILTGAARFVDDLDLPGALHLAFVRSQAAHATIVSVDTGEAEKMPGVVAVYTAETLEMPTVPGLAVLNPNCARPPLAVGKARFVGDAVAVVVAETRAQAVDAAEQVIVDLDLLPAVADMEAALEPGAPLQFEDMGTNLAGGFRDPDDIAPLDGADVVVRGRFENTRVAVMSIEGNAVAVIPGGPDGPYDLTAYVGTQMPHMWRTVACKLFGLDAGRVRVVTPHVGGAFGGKVGVAAEHAVAVAAARLLSRPVKWVESRSENLVAMPHGRGQVQYIELGLKHDGTFTGLRCRVIGDAGAYAGFGGALAQWTTRLMAQGPYHIPKIAYDVASVLTNTTPMGAFRGAGRPEATAFLERIVDMAADEVGLDPLEIRRRNFLGPAEFPYSTLMGATYDSGEYAASLGRAAELAGYDALRAEQAQRRSRGDRLQLGIGVSAYVEVTAGGGGDEYGAVEAHTDGTFTAMAGTSAHGQGHATAFSMLVADRLNVPLEKVRFVQSDTAVVPKGGGTGGSRSLQVGGSAVAGAADALLEKAKEVAANLLEADPADIVLEDDGRIGVAGVPARSLGWGELAQAAERDGSPLAAAFDFKQEGATFPFGAHVAVVEVDMETGSIRFLRHVAVDDCGRILNPLLVEGQQHGGIAQGVAQALWEQVVYDEDGNPLTTTLADYMMPSAAELVSFEAANTETPTPLNPLGAKGIGESGTIGAMPAVQNAVVDALSHLGVRHLDVPCTPERVWRAIEAARDGSLASPWRDPPAAMADLPLRPGSAGSGEGEADI